MKIEDTTTQGGFVLQGTGNNGDNTGKLKLFCLGLLVLVLAAAFTIGRSISQTEKAIDAQKTQLAALTEELEGYQDAQKEAEDKKGDASDTVSENDRSAKDYSLAREFLKTLLTWDSYQNYSDIRNTLASEYGMAADSQVLSSFMPEISEETLGDSNMRFEDMDAYEVHADGDTIQYFAICSVRNRIDGNVGTGKVAVFYSVHGDGSIHDISAYSLAR